MAQQPVCLAQCKPKAGDILAKLVGASKPEGKGTSFIGLDDEVDGVCINKGEGGR